MGGENFVSLREPVRCAGLPTHMLWRFELILLMLAVGCFAGEKTQLIDPTEGPDSEKLAPRSRAEIVDDSIGEAVALDVPRTRIAIDGEVYPGAWNNLRGSAKLPEGTTLREVLWTQKAGPKLNVTDAELKRAEIWVFTIQPGNYSLIFKARNENGWSKPAEVRFSVAAGRPYLSEQDGYQLAGSGERIVLPGGGWKQIAGPEAVFRPARQGVAVRPNDAGLYIFEAPRLEGLPERRGVRVPPGKNGVLGDRRPIARIAKNLSGVAGRAVELDGTLSIDPDPGESETLKAKWSTPDIGRGAEIEARAGIAATFKARRPGAYSVTLVVSDGRLDSAPETVFIDIAPGRDNGAGSSEIGDDDEPASIKSDPLNRRVSLTIWPADPLADGTVFEEEDAGLERAVQMFNARCGIALLVDPTVAKPAQFKEFTLSVAAMNTPLRHLLDGIARQTGTRYRIEENRAAWLVKPAAFYAQDELVPIAVGIDALHEKPDGADMLAPLRDYLKPILEAREGTSLTYESPRQEIVGVLPRGAAARLKEVISSLREPAGIGLRYPEQPTKAEQRLKMCLSEKTITAHGRYRFDRLLREITEKTGIAIGYDPHDFPKRIAPILKVNFEATPLRQVLRDLAAGQNFDGVTIEAPAGAWFFKGLRPYPGGELLAQTAVVRSYDLSAIYAVLTPQAAALLSGEAIAYAVRSRVYPASWSDPGTTIFYHPTTRKLLVVHTPQAQRKVLDVLNDVRDRGEWALGAAE